MSAPLWLHCNFCFKMPANAKKYHISNCGHIGCESCFQKSIIAPTCYLCKSPTKATPICKDMNEDLVKYFSHLNEHVKKAFMELESIIAFQWKNTRSLMQHKMKQITELQNMSMKRAEDLEQIERLKEQVKELKTKNAALEAENQNLNNSFRTQQTLVNQFLTVNATGMNTTQSFFNTPSRDVTMNRCPNDIFNIIDASYLSQSLEPQRRMYDNYIANQQSRIEHQHTVQESPMESFLVNQSSMNTSSQPPFLDRIIASSQTAHRLHQVPTTPSHSTAASFPQTTPFKFPKAMTTNTSSKLYQNAIKKTPSKPQLITSEDVPTFSTPSQDFPRTSATANIVKETPLILKSTSETQKTPLKASRPPRTKSQSVGQPQRYAPQKLLEHQQQAEKLNVTTRSWAKIDRPLKTPVLNKTHPSISKPSQRSRSSCPHWPKTRCKCG